jgi:hypothetical protein
MLRAPRPPLFSIFLLFFFFLGCKAEEERKKEPFINKKSGCVSKSKA